MIQGRLLPLLAVCFIAPACVYAQSTGPSAIDAAGTSVTTGGNTYEYAIGQVVSGATYSDASLIVTPGVIQPNFSSSGIGAGPIQAVDLQVYPSPVEHTLFLDPSFAGAGVLHFRLLDAAGKLVMSREAKLSTGRERQTIDVSAIAAGQYLLHVEWLQNDKSYNAGYKLQKIK